MTLKIKKPNITKNTFSKKLSAQEERVTRKIIISKEDFKKIKLISLQQDKSLYALLNNQLQEDLEQGLIRTYLDHYDNSAGYKNFAMNALIFKQVKKYCIENDMPLNAFLHESLIEILEKG